MRLSQSAARRKLLALLSRSQLENLSGLERPWMANRADLVINAALRWDADEVEAAIKQILEAAK